MRYFLLTCGIILLQLSFVNGQDWQWGQQLKSPGNVTPVDIVSDNLDNVYVGGKFDSGDLTVGTDLHINAGDWDVFLASFSSDGTYRWSVQLAGLGRDDVGAIAISQTGILYVVGSFKNNAIYFTPTDSLQNTDNYDAFLAAYNTDGNFLFAKSLFWGTSTEKLLGITVNESLNRLAVTGNFKTELIYNDGTADQTVPAVGPKDQFVAEFDLNGDYQNISVFTVTQKQTTLTNISVCIDGGYFIGGDLKGDIDFNGLGSLSGDAVNMDAMIFRVDENLNYLWGRLGKGTGFEHVNSSTSDVSSNTYLVGKVGSNPVVFDSTATLESVPVYGFGLFDMYVAKYNRTGTLQWIRRIGSSGEDNAYGVNLFEDQVQFAGIYAGQVIINQDTLDSGSPTNNNTGFFVYDINGNPVAGEEITGDLDDQGQNLVINLNGKTLITGFFTSTSITAGPITLTNTSTIEDGSDGFLFKYGYNFTASIVKDKFISCNGTSDGQLIVSAFYGVPPYTYAWVGPGGFTATNDTISNLLAGTYTVTVTDAISDTVVVSSTLDDPLPVSVTSTITDITCNRGDDGAITLTVSGGTVSGDYLYSWSTEDGSGLIAGDKDQTGLSAGTYSVKVTDDNGCYDSVANVVNEPIPFSFAGSQVTDIVTPPGANGAITLNVSNGVEPYTYLWGGPNGFTSTDKDLTGLVDGGSYIVSAMDNIGCARDTTFTVNDNAAFLAFILADSTKNVSCKGGSDGSATVTTTGGRSPFNWVWTDDSGTPIGANDSVLTGAPAGFYHVLVTDADSKTANADVAISEPITALAMTHDATFDISCNGAADGAINITVNGGTIPYSYSWTGPGGYTSIQSDITNLGPGDYDILVTDANGCQIGINTIEVVEPPLLEIPSIDILQDVLCNGSFDGKLEANPVGGFGDYSYLWNDGGSQNTKQATSLPAGTYTVTVTDENGCTAQGNQTLTEPDVISVAATIQDVSCYSGADGAITLEVTGGTSPYNFLWSSGETTKVISGLPVGDYSVTITDFNSCSKDTTFSVIEPPEIIIDSVSVTDVLTCVGDATGELVVHARGGTTPLQYSIDGGVSYQADSVFPNLAAGNYDIAVSDANSCPLMGNTVTINEPEPVVINSVTPTDVTGCAGDNNGALLVDATGGTAPYEYSIDDGASWQTDPNIIDLTAGTYTVMVQDQHACTITGDPVEIGEPVAVTVSSTVVDASCNSSTTGEITIHATGGTGSYEYSIDGGTSFVSDSVFIDLSQGSYTLTARDANSCVSADELVNVEEPDAILITSEDATHTCLGEATGSVIVTAQGGIGTLIYTLKIGANIIGQNSDGNFTDLKIGNYTVEVNDENDCGPVVSNTLEVTLSPTQDCTIELYNAFSPNGDGINEKWTIYRIWNYPNATVKIFNSWGTIVFNSAVGYPEPWDGTYNGEPLPAGTYYYIIDLDNGENPKTGTVNIIK